ncbi:MAG: hypothetical protein D3924_05615 [Candidatus Electrothrix sp. AR4]|nr:hypothetical protein [Candidatus Electrothrix sp. AR4]
MSEPFTQDRMTVLSAQIDEQLLLLRSQSASVPVRSEKNNSKEMAEHAPKQWQAITKVIEEDPQTFWQRFRKAAHNDLCDKGGVLTGSGKSGVT